MNKLFTRYLNSAAFFEAPDDKGSQKLPPVDPKAAAKAERDAIDISDSTSSTKEEKEEDWPDQEEEEKEEEKDEDDSDEEKEEEKEKEEKEETEEQKTARLADEKEERKKARQQRKWDKLAAEKTAAEKKVAELEAKLKEQPVEGLTEEEVERRAKLKAEEALTAKEKAQQKEEFEAKCDKIDEAARKIDKDFPKKLDELVAELGVVPGQIINILAELDNENGGDVLSYLVNNVDDAEDIFELKNNASKLTLKLVRISDKLKAAKAPPPRQRSKVPPPIAPVNEGRGGDLLTAPLTGKEDMDIFAAKRARQIEERRRNRGY